jgi:hypothetical protein
MGSNIKVDLRETGWEGVNWIWLRMWTDRLLGFCKHGTETSGFLIR